MRSPQAQGGAASCRAGMAELESPPPWGRDPAEKIGRLKPALQAQTKTAIIPTTSKKASPAQGYATSVALATGWRGLARVRSHENYETSLCRACVAAPCCRRLYSFFRCDIRCIYVFDKIYGRKSSALVCRSGYLPTFSVVSRLGLSCRKLLVNVNLKTPRSLC